MTHAKLDRAKNKGGRRGRVCVGGIMTLIDEIKHRLIRLTALCLLLHLPTVAAQSVALKGISGKKALVSVNGAAPSFRQEGQTISGVTLERVDATMVRFGIGGEKFNLHVGDTRANAEGQVPPSQNWAVNTRSTSAAGASAPQNLAAAVDTAEAKAGRLSIKADVLGHYRYSGQINDQPVQFLVDTGASAVSMPVSVAEKIGLDYRQGKKVAVNTAGGKVEAYTLDLAEVRLGTLALQKVSAVVLDAYAAETHANQQSILLGMSFLSRVKMSINEKTMLLEKP